MNRYTYQIKDTVSGETYKCLHEPGGWDSYGVTFGRETGISNVVKGYVSQWTFIKEDARWLKRKLFSSGTNRRLRLRVLDTANLGSSIKVIYEGDIDLTLAEWNGNTFEVPTSDGGFFKALENKWDEKYEIPFDRYCRIDGAVFSDTCHLEGSESIMTADFNRMNDFSNSVHFGSNVWYGYKGQRVNVLHNVRRDTANDTAMQREFLHDVEMESVNFEYYDNQGNRHNDPTVMTETGAFFVCRSQVVNKLEVKYEIKTTGRLSGIRNNHHNAKVSYHRLCIYGIPLSRYENPSNNYDPPAIWYAYSSKHGGWNGSQYNDYDFSHVGGYVPNIPDPPTNGEPRTGKQFYAVLSQCVESVTPYKAKETNANGGTSNVWRADYTASFSGTFTLTDFDTLDGQGMVFFIVVDFDIQHKIKDDSTFEVRTVKNYIDLDFAMRLNNGKMIAAIKAADAFRQLIGKISDGRYNVTFNTADFDTLAENDLLTMHSGMKYKSISAQNRRFGLHGSLTTSLSDFLKYAYAVYGIQIGVVQNGAGYLVTLAHFGMMYEKTTVIGTVENFNELKYSVDRDMLYSTIKVGFSVDNDTLNGEKEYNNEQVWDTPNTEIEGGELDITSPYCASSKAIETFIYNNYRTPDDKSREDTDVYLIDAAYSYDYQWENHGQVHELSRVITVLAGITYPDTQWNLKFTPKRMLNAHSLELNSYFALDAGKMITIQTCDLNRSLVSYDGTPPSGIVLTPVAQGGGIPQTIEHGTHYPAGSIIEAADITIGTGHRFIPMTAEFNAIAGKEWIPAIEAARLGVIVLDLGDKTIRGYIANGSGSVTVNPMKASAGEFTILLTDIPTDL